jgi:hypothetical protein
MQKICNVQHAMHSVGDSVEQFFLGGYDALPQGSTNSLLSFVQNLKSVGKYRHRNYRTGVN